MNPDLLVIAQTVCTLPQCSVCQGLEPGSWAWIFAGCWLVGLGPVLANLGAGVVMALYAGIQLWSPMKGRGQ
jgi:hypothetical protein